MMKNEISTDLIEKIEYYFSEVISYESLTKWNKNLNSTIWIISTCQDSYCLKLFGNKKHFDSEKNVYENWQSSLNHLKIPKLISIFPQNSGLLFSFEKGKPASKVFNEMPLERILATYRYAGKFLKNIHELPVFEIKKEMIISETEMKVKDRLYSNKDILPKGLFNWGTHQLNSILWKELEIGFCHMDFSPRNWLISNKSADPTIIDFEHSRVDFVSRDVLKLWDSQNRNKVKTLTAFYEGYGLNFKKKHLKDFKFLGLVHGLGILNWALENSDKNYFRFALNVLTKAMENDGSPYQ